MHREPPSGLRLCVRQQWTATWTSVAAGGANERSFRKYSPIRDSHASLSQGHHDAPDTNTLRISSCTCIAPLDPHVFRAGCCPRDSRLALRSPRRPRYAIRNAAQTHTGQRLTARLGEGQLQVRVEDNHLTPVTLSLLD